MSLIKINCVKRSDIGSAAARSHVKKGLVPGVVYSKKSDNINLLISQKQLEKLTQDISFMTRIFELNFFDQESIENVIKNKDINSNSIAKYRVIPKDIQCDKIKDTISHIDFAIIEDEKEIDVKIPICFVNRDKCETLKYGGRLLILDYNPKIRCKIDFIPEVLDIDLENKKVNSVIRIADINLPDGCREIKNTDIAKIFGKRGKEEEEKINNAVSAELSADQKAAAEAAEVAKKAINDDKKTDKDKKK